MSGIEDKHLDVLQNIEFAAVRVYRADPPLHDVDVQDAVGVLVRHYHAEDGARQPPAAELAGRARQVATEVNPTVEMMPPMAGVVGLPQEDARRTTRIRRTRSGSGPWVRGTALPHSGVSGGITPCAGARQPQCRNCHRVQRYRRLSRHSMTARPPAKMHATTLIHIGTSVLPTINCKRSATRKTCPSVTRARKITATNVAGFMPPPFSAFQRLLA